MVDQEHVPARQTYQVPHATTTDQPWGQWCLINVLLLLVNGQFTQLEFVQELAYLALLIGPLAYCLIFTPLFVLQWGLLRRLQLPLLAWFGASQAGVLLLFTVHFITDLDSHLQALGRMLFTNKTFSLLLYHAAGGILFGAGIGWCQWVLLRRYKHGGGWWFASAVVGYALASLLLYYT